jgi:DNA polymerase-3 subunit alpha
MATPLHNHTHYSALDGLSKPEEIAEAISRLGFEGAACTDHGLVSGHLDFHKAMTDRGLKPILGMEAYQALDNRRLKERDSFHLLLLAKTTEGLRNLWAMSSEAHGTGFYYKPRVDWELLEKYHEGIICTSACLGSLLSQSFTNPDLPDSKDILQRYLDIFKGDFYLEVHTYDGEKQDLVNRAKADLGREFGVPLVYANDAHYSFKDQWDLHEGILKLTMNAGRKAAEDAGRDKVHPQCLYIMDEKEIGEHLGGLTLNEKKEAIGISDEIASQVEFELPGSKKRTPMFVPDKGYKTNEEMFLGLLEKGFQEKVLDWKVPGFERDPKVYLERMEHETDIILDAGLADYFLIVQDYVAYAKKNGVVVGPGRGSAGGSLVSYLLGITDVDPIHYDLLFERFYNPGREKGLPDIDIDFDVSGREKVKRYVSKKYRPENVADIGNVVRMGPKGAFRAMGRVLKIPYAHVEWVSKLLDQTVESGLWSAWDDILETEVTDPVFGTQTMKYMLSKISRDPKDDGQNVDLWIEWAVALMGKNYGDHHTGYVSTYSTHASAVIVADEPLEYTLPLRWAASDQKLVTQWDMHRAEELGFMKMDFLGLTQLSILDEADRIIKAQGEPVPKREEIQYMPHPDELWHLFDFGLTTGIFQMDASATGRGLCKRVKPRNVEDLAFIVAVNRPGPLIAGSDQKYIAGKQGEPVVYTHDTVKRVTEKTFGEFIYQEQVIRFFQEVGYSLSEADDIRKIMGKKLRERMLEEEPRYMERACQHMPKEVAETIWETLVWFSKYAFNKSHAVQYGLIALWAAYYKWKYPAEYMLAGMTVDDKKNRSKWINEAMRMGVEVLPPDINTAGVKSQIVDGKIVLGLTMIKGMGAMHSKWVVDNRPYTSYEEFLHKAETIKYEAPNGVKKILMDKGRSGKLFDVGAFDSLEDRQLTKAQKIAIEEELLTVALSDDSERFIDQNSDLIDEFCVPLGEIDDGEINKNYTVAGVIRQVTFRKTKKGDPMAFVTIQKGSDEVKFAVWQEGIKRYRKNLEIRTPIMAELKKKERGTELLKLRPLR